tara:strand:+ start:1254 stop:2468 length:1215 start_codon:yes stop_codon:yes gene_type:complete
LRNNLSYLLIFLIFSCSGDSIDENISSVVPQNPSEDSNNDNSSTNSSSNTSTTDNSSNQTTPQTFNREQMLIFWADSIIIPSQNKFQSDLIEFSNSVNSFSNDPTQASLDLIRENWVIAYKSWQHIEMFNIGKAEEINYGVRMNIYPANVERIELNVSNNDNDIEHPNDYPAQGLPAVDYLLYGIGNNDSEILEKFTLENSKYLNYLIVVSNKMIELTDNVVSDWDESYRNVFIASTDNTATSSINKLTNDFIYYYEKGFRANKFGIPAGVFSGSVLIDRVEAYYRRNLSKILALEAIDAITNFFNGIPYGGDSANSGLSFKNYVEFLETVKNDVPLGQLILDQFTESRSNIANLEDDFTIQLENKKLEMLSTYDIIQVAVVYLKVDMLQALNINVDYIDADGD